MLEKPNLKDTDIARCVENAYGLNIEKISFLPLGADLNTAVYRITASNKSDYFLKLRRNEFNEAGVSVPKCLADSGLKQVIPPIATKSGKLWASLEPFKVILYPYVQGHDGNEVKLSDHQWVELGKAIKKLHSTDLPSSIIRNVPREEFSSKRRQKLEAFLNRIEAETFQEPVAREMALFLKSKNDETLKLISRAEELCQLVQKQSLDQVLCHADLHGWNLLMDEEESLYVVDWDTLILAPKERDLMFIGAGISDSGRSPIEEEKLFYQGYAQADISQAAIAYYRYERIIEDMTVYCEQIFLSDDVGEDRQKSVEYLKANFLPDGTIERALQVDHKLGEE